MKKFKSLALLSLVLFTGVIVFSALQIPDKNFGNKEFSFSPFVIMELFTSQGCSSCPPADQLLGKYALRRDPHIIPLAYHVDYWDHLGWKDPFSSRLFSERQEKYGVHFRLQSIYTPQLIINGEKEIVGSNGSSIGEIVKEELTGNSPVDVQGTVDLTNEGKLNVHYKLRGNLPSDQVNLVIAEKKSTTSIRAGENAGRSLENYNIVRSFVSSEGDLKPDGNLSTTIPDRLSLSDVLVVLFVQEKESMKIKGGIICNN